jgi:hypothetical protein
MTRIGILAKPKGTESNSGKQFLFPGLFCVQEMLPYRQRSRLTLNLAGREKQVL